MARLRRLASSAACLLLLGSLSTRPSAQYNERPDLVGSGGMACDASGRSIKNLRVRAIHTTDPALPGGTAYFQERDPFLAYQLGRNLNFREFRTRDGVFSSVGGLGGPMPDGTTAKITANNQTSCLGCHNLPPGNPGGGTNFHKDSGFGRNAPHYYGAGIVEMLAIQIRAEVMLQCDLNGDGWIDAAEASSGPDPILVAPSPGATPISYGSPRLSGGMTGTPNLNNIFRVWYVDANGQAVAGAPKVDGLMTAGYNFEVVVWGWGQGGGRSALNPTNRAFYWDPANAHSGLQAFDPSTTNDPDGDGVSLPTNAGAIQFPATHVAPDAGGTLDPLGFSLDDPDKDGYLNELSEGDLDLAEWFMLNIPRPAFAGPPEEFNRGVKTLDSIGCSKCHVSTWSINSRNDHYAGDRRFFDLDVTWSSDMKRLEGELIPLATKVGSSYLRHFGPFEVTGLFSDLKHHDMGQGFRELDFAGFQNTIWRTPPLWGVGSGFPWGHDGQSLTIRDAILRHGGEGAASRAAFRAMPVERQELLLDFLSKLVLYDIESLPADINGDGTITADFPVLGMSTGVERLNPEWLFVNALQIQGPVLVDGKQITSHAGVNIPQAYGQQLLLRQDSDKDGWPDAWDRAPFLPGYLDGVN